ncbi:hypothetical protein AERO8C_30107 [Aeromonas veronii]|uniref:Uncharacterized protein n=1 Tax=Aeromonas veronii TaxID=654 RepID=A0A653L6Z7_AERVE|nr:hypothetical protein AERO8C_30107 [Aeromonas veronii]
MASQPEVNHQFHPAPFGALLSFDIPARLGRRSATLCRLSPDPPDIIQVAEINRIDPQWDCGRSGRRIDKAGQ